MEKINIFGTGRCSVLFVYNNPEYVINCFIEGKKKNVNQWLGKPVYNIENAVSLMRNSYTVVACNEITYSEIKQQLEDEYKLEEFLHFEFYKTYKKEIAICYGNCHTRIIKQMLESNKPFNEKYGFYPIPQIQKINEQNKIMMNSSAFQKCKLFLHACIRKDNKYGEWSCSDNQISKLSRECHIIGFPNLYGMPKFLFPQVDYSKEYKFGNESFYHIGDNVLDKNCKSGLSKLTNMICYEKVFSDKVLTEVFDSFWHKLIKREEQWDIKVFDFIKKNYKKRHLFYDPYHPTNYFFEYVVDAILAKLNIVERKINVDRVIPLDHDEIPIYGCVKNFFHLEYVHTKMRSHSSNVLNEYSLDIEEYIAQYMLWTHGVDIRKKL